MPFCTSKNGPRRGPSFNGVCKLMRRSIETLSECQAVRSRLIRISAEATALHGRRERTQQIIVVAKIAAPEHGLETVVPLNAEACVKCTDFARGNAGRNVFDYLYIVFVDIPSTNEA